MRTISLLACFFVGTPALFAQDQITVAAWNLGGFTPLEQEKVAGFVEVIHELDLPEVLLLVEVNPSWIASEIVAELMEDPNVCYRRAIPEQPKANQEIALIYSCDVGVEDVQLIPGSDLDRRGYRQALAANVQAGEFDFVIIGVHLKASRGSRNRDRRDEQNEIIADFIDDATSGAERDVLVVGDYNMIPGEDDTNFDTLSNGGFIRFISSEDLVGQGSHISSGAIGNLLDGYGISDGHTAEYIEGSLEIVQAHDLVGLSLSDFGSDVSDHLPLVAEFEIDSDDD